MELAMIQAIDFLFWVQQTYLGSWILQLGEGSKEEFIYLCQNMKQDIVCLKSYAKKHQIL